MNRIQERGIFVWSCRRSPYDDTATTVAAWVIPNQAKTHEPDKKGSGWNEKDRPYRSTERKTNNDYDYWEGDGCALAVDYKVKVIYGDAAEDVSEPSEQPTPPGPPQPTEPPTEETSVPDGTYEDPTGTYDVSDGAASFTKPADSAAEAAIPDTISVNGQKVKVTAIAANAFAKDTNLTTVSIGKNVKTIGKNAFAGCAKLKTVKGGKNIITIKDKAFSGCKALKTFPALGKLKTIGANAFKGCAKLAKFTLGSSVKSIGKNAFNGCKALKTITVKTTKLTASNVKSNAFKGINKKATFKCPKKKLEAYKTLFIKRGAPKTAKFK